jgi:hypothetical protein
MRSKMLLIKEFKIAITLLEILVSGCTCFRVSTDPFEFTNALENVIDKGVQDRHRLVGDTGIRSRVSFSSKFHRISSLMMHDA